ncbi:MAG: hypothetical protein A4E36_01779 [Methanoregulaceae archaeon PtaB.Bin009]|nr:MAG: hypothetical protein A4E36_01779 [Methanoregulaceae archaeon PtaB.Bin009]OPY41666.1 MAG: hypothetical protein A4E41_00751 [Methanoregulaceae archaeon PtaU1.Bin066]
MAMAFDCRQCGRCCMHLGDYIEIEREVGPFEFTCCSVSSGTTFTARVDADKQDLFSDRTWIREHPAACPFLRPSGTRIVCTIHHTSPAQCKAYRCVIARIYSPDGVEMGYITGTRALHSSDPALRAAWDEVERAIAACPEDAESRIAPLLARRGYRCE